MILYLTDQILLLKDYRRDHRESKGMDKGSMREGTIRDRRNMAMGMGMDLLLRNERDQIKILQ